MSTLQLIPASGNPVDVQPDQKKLVIGRSVASDIVFDDASISRRHLSLEQREVGFFVTDLGSANGCFLDGVRFKEIQLRDGAELRLGSFKLKVRIVAEEGDSEATIMVDIDEVTGEMPPVPRRPGADEEATASMPSVTAASELEDLVSSPPPPVVAPPPPSRPARPRADDAIDQTVAESAEDLRASAPPSAAAKPPPPAGAKRQATPGSAPVPQMSAPPPEKKGRHPALWVGIGCGGCLLSVILLFAVIGGGVFYFTQGAAQGVEDHLEALRSGEHDAAYEMLSESYRARLTPEDFARMLIEHPSLAANQSSSFSSRSVDNDTARLSGTLTSETGGVEPVVFELVKELGAWHISDIRFEPPD